jgi:hypothetical protein
MRFVRVRYRNLAEERKHPRRIRRRKVKKNPNKPKYRGDWVVLDEVKKILLSMNAAAIYHDGAWKVGPIGKISILDPENSTVYFTFECLKPDHDTLLLGLRGLVSSKKSSQSP